MSCGNQNGNMIPVLPVTYTGTGKEVVIIEGVRINVEDLSDTETYRFRINHVEYLALTATLGLTAKAAGVIKTSPVLKGTILDRIEFTFAYNKVITSQTLTNTGGLTPPVLAPGDTLYNDDPVAVTTNITFTLTGNDGEGQPGSVDTDVKSISFGNVMYLGHGPDKVGTLASGIEAFIEALGTSSVKTARTHNYFATGGVNEHHFVAYPKAWGEAVFTKGIFSGGYVRLKNVGGTMEVSGTPETDVSFTNAAGFTEEYYIYQSLYDNQNDAVTPFIIS